MALETFTTEQARQNPGMFLYIFAPDEFLKAIPRKYANIIIGKAANQNKILLQSAKKYGITREDYTNAIREGFMEIYGKTPIEGLVILAQGGELAGKNWSEGVFGVGALSQSFTKMNATVNPDTGVTSVNGVTLGVSNVVYSKSSSDDTAEVYQVFCTDNSTGVTYMSQLKNGKYYAKSYSDKDGVKYNYNGVKMSSSDAATFWENILLWVQKFVDLIISIFGKDKDAELITASNTLPSQTTDGFVQESGFSEAGMLLLALVAGGALLTGGIGSRKKKSY